MDDRKLTLIVVPHGDLETRTFEISYRKLRLLAWGAFGAVCVAVVLLALWWSVAAKAAKVGPLQDRLAEFEKDRAKVDSLAHLLAEVEGQYERVRQLLGANAPVNGERPTLPDLGANTASTISDTPVIDAWPLQERGFVTRGLSPQSNHPGLDIAVPQNSYIRAAGPGTVLVAGEDSIYGRYIRIDHGGGFETLYGHASRLLVSRGDEVKRAQVIGLSGNTGRSTAPHLHFEVRKNGAPVDPKQFVRQP